MFQSNRFPVRSLALAGLIAALYAVLTIALAPLSYGPVQFRFAEALCVLPMFTPAAIPGLFIGCVIANLVGGNGPWDVVVGSLATLSAACLTYFTRKNRILAVAWPVVVNAVVIGVMLTLLFELPLVATVLSVGAGQAVVCYGLGLTLSYLLERLNILRRVQDDQSV